MTQQHQQPIHPEQRGAETGNPKPQTCQCNLGVLVGLGVRAGQERHHSLERTGIFALVRRVANEKNPFSHLQESKLPINAQRYRENPESDQKDTALTCGRSP
jgi:hypothetical protein